MGLVCFCFDTERLYFCLRHAGCLCDVQRTVIFRAQCHKHVFQGVYINVITIPYLLCKSSLVGNGIKVKHLATFSHPNIIKLERIFSLPGRNRMLDVPNHFLWVLPNHDDAQGLHLLDRRQCTLTVSPHTRGERERHARLVCGREAFFLDAGGQAAGQQQEHRAGVFQ